MGVVQSLTAARMLAIEAASVVAGTVTGDNLWLTRHDGSSFDAGVVRGASQLPNKVQNSRFLINQRNAGPIDLINSVRSFGADRWGAVARGPDGYIPAVFSVETEAPGVLPESDTGFMRLDTSLIRTFAGFSNAYVNHYIEDVGTLSGRTVTLSFWAKCVTNETQKLVPAFIQSFGAGGSTSVTVTLPTVTVNRTWFRYSMTFDLPSLVGKTIMPSTNHLELRMLVCHESNPAVGFQKDKFDFWGVQLEEGSNATPLRMDTYANELAACQRYYWKLAPSADAPISLWLAKALSATTAQAWVPFPVPMYKVPTVTFSSFAPVRNDGDYIRDFTSITVMNNADPEVRDIAGVSIRGNGSSGPSALVVGDANILNIHAMDGYVAFHAEL